MLNRVVISLGIVLVGFFVVALAMPAKWHVERSITIAARRETILPCLSTLRRWKDWAAWSNETDPQAKWTFSGPESGPGAVMEWNGPKLGVGKVTVVEASAKAGLRYDMVMVHGTPAKGTFTFSDDGQGTRVTWIDQGDMGFNLVGRFFVSMIEEQLGQHFETGLGKLKTLAEAAQKGFDAQAKEIEDKGAAPAAAIGQ